MIARAIVLEGGEYDLWRREGLRAELESVQPSQTVAIDLQNTTFIDAGAITLLVQCCRRVRHRYPEARVALLHVAPSIRRLLGIARVDEFFEFPA